MQMELMYGWPSRSPRQTKDERQWEVVHGEARENGSLFSTDWARRRAEIFILRFKRNQGGKASMYNGALGGEGRLKEEKGRRSGYFIFIALIFTPSSS